MYINITDVFRVGHRRFGIDESSFISMVEAYLYYNNEYKEHMIEDIYDTNLPMVDAYLLDYITHIDYIEDYMGLSHEHVYEHYNNIFNSLDRLDKYMLYDVNLNTTKRSVTLECIPKGNVLELRYLDLIRYKNRKG